MIFDRDKYKEIFGFEFGKRDSDFGGLTRNNPMFKHIYKWKSENIASFKIKKVRVNNENRYKFIFKKYDGEIIEDKTNSSKSFGTRLLDFMLVDPSYEGVLKMIGVSKKDDFVIQKFQENVGEEMQSLEKAYSMLEEPFSDLLNYWKKLSSTTNHYSDWVRMRINTIVYEMLLELDAGAIGFKFTGKKGGDQGRLDILKKIVKYNISEFILDKSEEESIDDDWFGAPKQFDEYEDLEDELIVGTIDDDMHDGGAIIKQPSEEVIIDESKKMVEYKIEEIYQMVKRGEISIPTFQRDYVWNNDKIINLLNSLVKDYPIGSVLFGNSENNFNNKNEVVSFLKEDREKSNYAYMLLDGQQRITSILLCYAFTEIAKKMNFNIDNGLDEIINSKKIRDIYLYETPKKTVFLNRTQIAKKLKGKKSNFDEYKITNQKTNERLRELIGNYKIPALMTYNLDIDRLVDIFNNINMGSTKLSNVDLLHSFFYAQSSSYDLHKNVKQIRENKKYKDFLLTNDIIVQSCKLIHDYRRYESGEFLDDKIQEKIVDITHSSIFKLSEKIHTAGKYMRNWRETMKCIFATAKFLFEEYGFQNMKELPNKAFFFVTLALMVKYDVPDQVEMWRPSEQLKEEAKNTLGYILKRSINKDYSSGTSTKINSDLEKIFSERSFEEKEIHMDWDSLEKETNYKTKNSLYRVITSLITLKKPLSLINAVEKVKLNDKFSKQNKDLHHFIPQKCTNFLANEVLSDKNIYKNIFVIDSEENRKIINNRSPFDYFLEGFDLEKHDNEFRIFCNSHLLGYEKTKAFYLSRTKNALKEMLENRGDNILEFVEKKYGISPKG